MTLPACPHIVIATITEALGPVDRGGIYADPIDSALTTERLGMVTGGGSQLDADGNVAFVDIEIALTDLDDALERLRELLQQLGAPRGSVLTFTRDDVTQVISVETGEPATSPAGGNDDVITDSPDPATETDTSTGASGTYLGSDSVNVRIADAAASVPETSDPEFETAPSSAPSTALGGQWNVTTVDMTTPNDATLSFDALVQYALDQGTTQVGQVGSPLNPFLVYDTGRTHFFVCLEGNGDPLEIALHTLHADAVQPDACALVIDSRITTTNGGKTDAILVMASQRGSPTGVTWAQAYRPKWLFRSFKVLPFREQVATSRNLFDEAPVSAI